jgi:preprotein translocase subunit SecA
VAAQGGLYVIATERHESQRVDRQLFGRSARQGDPGSAQAFMSLEDDLFQRYLPRSVIKWLSKTAQQNRPLSGIKTQIGIKYAQNTAEKLAYKMRKSVLKTDDWMEDSLGFSYSELGH